MFCEMDNEEPKGKRMEQENYVDATKFDAFTPKLPTEYEPPKDFRPFNAEDAKAGAPFCCKNGREAFIDHWDMKCHCPLFGYVIGRDGSHLQKRWTGIGGCYFGQVEYDLVMLPLGYIEEKPVFYGDELIFLPTGLNFIMDHDNFKTLESWREKISWPKPKIEYPKTLLGHEEFCAIWYGDGNLIWRRRVENIANAALKDASDRGQVIINKEYGK